MSSQLASTLLAWRRHQRERYLEKGLSVPEWVFAAADGQLLEERNVRTAVTRLLEKAGLRHIRIHDLRHTFASLLLQQGESIVYVNEQLGHASIQITVDTYGHLIPDANRAAVDGLDDAPMHPDASQAQPQPENRFEFDGWTERLRPQASAGGKSPRSGARERAASVGSEAGAHASEVERSEPRWNRTINPQIKSLLLCQLS